jgi:transposase
MAAAFIGLDLAKSVFQVHGVDAHGKAVVAKRLRRDAVLAFFANLPPCVVGMEACAGSHFRAREIARLGHTVRLMAPQYVKPYVKRQKNDRADAEAICEAVQRPSLRFVPVKTEQQQGTLAIHRVRETLVGQKTQLINALRAHLAEFGIVAPQGAGTISELTAVLADLEDTRVPALARSVLQGLVDQLRDTERRVEELDARLAEQAREDKVCQRHDPGDRADHRDGAGGDDRRRHGLRVRPSLGGLAGPGAAPDLERRQGAPGRHLQGGRRLPAPDAGQWRPGGDALAGQDLAVAGRVAEAPALQRRGGGAGQQAGPDRLGRDGAR